MTAFKNFVAGLEILGQYIDPNDDTVVDGYADAVHIQLWQERPGPSKAEQEKLGKLGWFRYAGPRGEYPLAEDGTGIWDFR